MARRVLAHVRRNAVAYLALGGTSYAAVRLPKNSVGSAQIKQGAGTLTKVNASARRSLRGATGPAGPKGEPGPTASAAAAIAGSSPIANGATATILALSTPGLGNTGPIVVGFPARLQATAAVGAFKTTTDAALLGRLECRLVLTPLGAPSFQGIGAVGETTFEAEPTGRAVVRSIALSGSADVDPGTYDVGVRCEALNLSGVTAPISRQDTALQVIAVGR